MHEDNSSNQPAHEIPPIHLSLNLQLEESFHFSNLIFEVEKSGETCDTNGCHPVRSIETSNNSYPQTMHDLVQA